jgi:hypothetical protein
MDGDHARNLRDIQQEISAFALVGAVEGDQVNLALGTGAQSVAVGRLGTDLFATLGVSPRLGRAFGPRDFEPVGRVFNSPRAHQTFRFL